MKYYKTWYDFKTDTVYERTFEVSGEIAFFLGCVFLSCIIVLTVGFSYYEYWSIIGK